MAKFQLPTSTKGGSKGFAPPRKTATKTAPRPKARPLAPARFESKPPPPPPTDPVGAWACLYAKKGPKKKITWLDGEVVREPYPGNMHRVRLVDADTKAQVTSTTKPASLAPFEVDKDDETCFSGYRLQITARLRGAGPRAPAAPPAPARPGAARARPPGAAAAEAAAGPGAGAGPADAAAPPRSAPGPASTRRRARRSASRGSTARSSGRRTPATSTSSSFLMRRRGSWSRARRCRRLFEISKSTTTTRRPSAATACRSRTGCAAASRPARRRPCGAASPGLRLRDALTVARRWRGGVGHAIAATHRHKTHLHTGAAGAARATHATSARAAGPAAGLGRDAAARGPRVCSPRPNRCRRDRHASAPELRVDGAERDTPETRHKNTGPRPETAERPARELGLDHHSRAEATTRDPRRRCTTARD